MSDHILDRAGFLAALAKDDPERKLAEQHARSCPACRQALDEGSHLVALLQEALPLPPPSAEALERAAASIARERLDDTDASSHKLAWISAGAVALAWVFQLTVGGAFNLDLPCVAISLGVLTVAIASVTLLRGKEHLAVALVVLTSGVFAYRVGTTAGPLLDGGVRCSFRELWAAGIAWAIIRAFARREGIAFGRWNGTAVAAAGALAAHAGQHLACRTPTSGAHLFAFHFGAVILAALLGGVAGSVRPPLAVES